MEQLPSLTEWHRDYELFLHDPDNLDEAKVVAKNEFVAIFRRHVCAFGEMLSLCGNQLPAAVYESAEYSDEDLSDLYIYVCQQDASDSLAWKEVAEMLDAWESLMWKYCQADTVS